MKKTVLFLQVLVFLAFKFQAQNVKEEIIRINKNYFKTINIALRMTSEIYKNEIPKPIQSSKVTVYKKPGNYLLINGPTECLANTKYRVDVNHTHKTIMVNKIAHKAKEDKNPDVSLFDKKEFTMKMDTLLESYKKVTCTKLNETTGEIVFELNKSIYEFIKVIYDLRTYEVKEYFIKAKPLKGGDVYSCHMKQSPISTAKLNKETFSEGQYITLKNKKLVPAQKYSDYKIIDLRNKNS